MWTLIFHDTTAEEQLEREWAQDIDLSRETFQTTYNLFGARIGESDWENVVAVIKARIFRDEQLAGCIKSARDLYCKAKDLSIALEAY